MTHRNITITAWILASAALTFAILGRTYPDHRILFSVAGDAAMAFSIAGWAFVYGARSAVHTVCTHATNEASK